MRREKYEQLKHREWKDRVNKHVPSLAARVFALRGTGYNGFYYGLEYELGKVICLLNDSSREARSVSGRIMNEGLVESVFKQVAQIEAEVAAAKEKYEKSRVAALMGAIKIGCLVEVASRYSARYGMIGEVFDIIQGADRPVAVRFNRDERFFTIDEIEPL